MTIIRTLYTSHYPAICVGPRVCFWTRVVARVFKISLVTLNPDINK